MNLNGSLSIVFAASLSIVLSACGGGGGSSNASSNNTTNSNNTNNTNTTAVTEAPSTTTLPRVVNPINWKSSQLLTPQSDTDLDVEIVGTELLITIQSDNLSQGDHVQIYLDTDNTATTGFQFDNQAWSQSGVDYIIEDGDLFKSTANDTTWSWNTNAGDITYAVSLNKLAINIDLDLLGDICNNLNVGVMTRDDNWDIATFYPVSARMQAFTVSYCSTTPTDTEAPILTLTGANPLSLEVGSTYNELGATAIDDLDGNISSNIIITDNVNTAVAGNYTVTYKIQDNAGNQAIRTRHVIITAATPEGITVDGNGSDWINIPTLTSATNGIMKVTDDAEKIYILVNAENLNENTQIFMDTDNQASTGLNLASHMSDWSAGADYMLENNSLDKSTTNSALWSWDYAIGDIEFVKVGNILEVAIKKSDFDFLSNNIPMAFMSRDANWNVVYQIPEQVMPVYTLQFPSASNQVKANDDSVTVTHSGTINIDVLANDISFSNGALQITAIPDQANHGSATIVSNKIQYIANSGFTGTDSFSYLIANQANRQFTDIATVTVEVAAPTNTAPVANNDTASTQYNTQIAIDVLDNDTDANDDTLTISSIGEASNGQAIISGENIIYTPNTGFSGTDSLSYEIRDGNGGSDTANVTITINAPSNNAPTAINDSATTVGTLAKVVNVLTNDTDPDGDNLIITGVTTPPNGTANIIGTNQRIRYIANSGFSGTDTFTYTISDGNRGNSTATVTITVTQPPNNAPDAVEDVADVDFDKTVLVNVLVNDTDPDGDTLTVQSIDQPTAGSAVLNSDGTILFDPQGNVGSITVFYTVSDGRGGTDIAALTIASTDPNDGNDAYPQISNEVVSTPINTAIFIDVLANDTDADGDVLILDQVDQGSNGTTTKVNGGVLYTPNAGFTGTDIFYYGVHDGHGHNGSGNVTITVTP